MPTPIFVFLLVASFPCRSKSACTRGCDLALGSYFVSPNLTLSFISSLFSISPYSDILPYNPIIANKDSIRSGSRVNVPFPCNCINGDFLGSTFTYVAVGDDTYDSIATDGYANLTTIDLLVKFNRYPRTSIPKGGRVAVTVICSCGDQSVSMDYGLFVTHPLRAEDSLKSLLNLYSFSGKEDLLQRYNPRTNFSAGTGIVFIPTKGSAE